MNRITAVAVSSVFVAVIASDGCSKRLPHGGKAPVYPLLGAHAAVPCEGCHGAGTPEALPTDCMSCHDKDRPDAAHHVGLDCGNCHVPDGWAVGVYTGITPTDTTPITDTTTTPTAFVHPEFPPDELCWDCHEVDRKDADHYTDPDPLMTWDCGPCHALDTWVEETYEHPARTPHGTYLGFGAKDPSTWIVACDTCHPGGVLTKFDCSTCHLAIYPHYGDAVEPGPLADASCLVCHINGDL